MTAMDSYPTKQVVLPAHEARALRDEIIKLMAEKLELYQQAQPSNNVIDVQIVGGKF